MIQTLADALQERGYTELTPVQIAVTDPDLAGSDLLVWAQTGSGKTVGFGLAIAPTILGDAASFGAAAAPLALIIAPTRELALQVKRELGWLYGKAGAVVVSCVGGMDMRDERRALDRGAHVVVATPGRLRDHIMRRSLDMSALRAVVLDEADEMLDLGFREDLEFILGEAPDDRRTLMFSATVPRAIETLARTYQTDARRISTVSERSQHADIDYRALTVAAHDAENAIINVLRYYDAGNAIVFCNTRAMVSRLTARFANRGFSVVALSGELSQTERTHALQAMRDGRAKVCVATDVAARGIDLPNLELVVHAELPSNAEGVLHRSGRTGRAGRKGVSVLIVPVKMRKKAERLLGTARITATWAVPPSADEILAMDEERLLADPAWTDPVTEDEAAFAAKLLALHDPATIAAAYLRLYRARQSAPEDLSPADATPPPPRERKAFGPSGWFSVSIGRDQGAEARRLLPTLCRAGDLTKDDIGAIRIQRSESFVEISQSAIPGFLRAVGPEMTLEAGTTLRQLDGPPDLPNERTFDDAPRKAPRPAPVPVAASVAPAPVPTPVAVPMPAAPVQTPPPVAAPQPEPERKPRSPKGKPRPATVGDAPKWEKRQGKGGKAPGPGHVPYKDKRRDDDRPGGKPAFPRGAKPGGPTGARPAGAGPAAAKPYAAKPPAAKQAVRSSAADTSKRFVPPGKTDKAKPARAGGKPKFAKGGNATPRRGKPKG